MTQNGSATVHQISLNPEGGVPKHAVPRATVHTGGVAGDRQRNLKVHGGPERAVCLFSLERIQALQAEGHPIVPGSTGENLTIAGLDWDAIVPGTKLRIGEEVELEVLSYTAPCSNIADSFTARQFKRMSQKVHPGWSRVYARVLNEGDVRAGDVVRVMAAAS
ncbi:MAG TPA: MOSC domain-containing protein [Tepidisphaeraceae bacterium]|nr:MOSC domain-containing protein [Tepidisphaeraceae bacterium]